MSSIPRIRSLRPSDRDTWRGVWHGFLAFDREELDAGATGRTFERSCAGRELAVEAGG